jgi:hypothetical protein
MPEMSNEERIGKVARSMKKLCFAMSFVVLSILIPQAFAGKTGKSCKSGEVRIEGECWRPIKTRATGVTSSGSFQLVPAPKGWIAPKKNDRCPRGYRHFYLESNSIVENWCEPDESKVKP